MRYRLTLISAFLFLFTVSGVFAAWQYALGFVDDQSSYVGVSLSAFDYPPEEVLPDDEEADKIGENHLDLIKKILNEVSYGLNATKKPIIHETLNKVGDVIYSQQNVQGGNLKHLMIDKTSSYSLLFQIEYVSDNEYITYTYVAGDLSTFPIGDEIQAYKTVMQCTYSEEDGLIKWRAPVSYYGKAKVANSKISSSIRSIDSSTWRAV